MTDWRARGADVVEFRRCGSRAESRRYRRRCTVKPAATSTSTTCCECSSPRVSSVSSASVSSTPMLAALAVVRDGEHVRVLARRSRLTMLRELARAVRDHDRARRGSARTR